MGAVSAGLRAGLSLPQAFAYARDEVEEPLRTELRDLVGAIETGTPVGEALTGWAEAHGTEDARLIAGVLDLHRRSGGDLPVVLDGLTGTLRERRAAHRDVRALTAQARLSGVILGLLPIGFFAFLLLTSRREMLDAIATPIGGTALALASGSSSWRSRGSVTSSRSDDGARRRDVARRRGRGVCGRRARRGGPARWSVRAATIRSGRSVRLGRRRRHPRDGRSGTEDPTVPLAALLAIRMRRLAASRAEVRRRRAMDAEIPQLLDLLAAGSAAGLSAVAGLQRSVSVLRGPLGAELRASLDAVHLGARWKTELAAMTERLALPDLRRAMAVLPVRRRSERRSRARRETSQPTSGARAGPRWRSGLAPRQ